MNWYSVGCKSHAHCKACRTDEKWRASLHKAGLTTTANFSCPEGFTESHLPDKASPPNVATWKELHTYKPTGNSAQDEAFLADFTSRVPRINCQCRKHWREILQRIPVRWNDYFAWSVEVHNAVNTILNKPQFSV